MTDIKKIPKVDLHLHLDGSMSVDTILKLAKMEDIDLSSYSREQIKQMSQVGHDCCSLLDYLSRFDFTTKFLQSAPSLEIAAYEAVKQAAEHNCKYIEVRFAPALHLQKGLDIGEVIYNVTKGLKLGESHFNVLAWGIVICMRNHDQQTNMEVVRVASMFHGKGIVAVDSAGDEVNYDLASFEHIFKYANKLHMPCTIHAGEAAGPANILTAINKLGAVRIGHGTRLFEDPNIFNLMKKVKIPLEMCPTSNIQTKTVPNWDEYPIKKYLDSGIPITINTDNPGVSNTNITNEYLVVMDKFNFSLDNINELIDIGINTAFLSDTEKRILKHKMQCERESLHASTLQRVCSHR